jgi:hypothetical protein
MIQIWAIYRNGGDGGLGAAVAAQLYEVADRLPVQAAHAALVRGEILEEGNRPPKAVSL